ncbi:MAG: SCO family protein [Planctomycetes bacterium]|nr:SCO family protein [Planctomycetota bacterium]
MRCELGDSVRASERRPRRLVRGFGWGALLLAASFAPACSDDSNAATTLDARADSDARFGELVPFSLLDGSGRTVTNADLAGRVWIASFVFTTCTGPCPTISANLRAIQDDLPESGVGLISVSVDPATDTPAVLSEYARALGADASRWLFLTGEAAEIDAFLRSSFALPVERVAPGSVPVGEHVTHSTKLVVIDARGRVAGYYSGTEPASVREALERAKWLGAHGG